VLAIGLLADSVMRVRAAAGTPPIQVYARVRYAARSQRGLVEQAKMLESASTSASGTQVGGWSR
jgi:hypothetical protein